MTGFTRWDNSFEYPSTWKRIYFISSQAENEAAGTNFFRFVCSYLLQGIPFANLAMPHSLPNPHLVVEVWSVSLVWVVLIILTVVAIIHSLGLLSCMSLGLLTVKLVHTLRLSKSVDLTTGEASEKLLGKGVVDCLACGALAKTSSVIFYFVIHVVSHLLFAVDPRRASCPRRQQHHRSIRGRTWLDVGRHHRHHRRLAGGHLCCRLREMSVCCCWTKGRLRCLPNQPIVIDLFKDDFD